MKTIFVLCAVLSVAFANVVPDLLDLEFDESELDELAEIEDLELFAEAGDAPVTDEQVQCIMDKTKKLVEKYPELEGWYAKTEPAGFKLLEKMKACYKKTGIRRKLCEPKLVVSALSFLRSTKKSLPKGCKNIMEEFKGYVTDCTGIKIPI